jgi:hypothetical protein
MNERTFEFIRHFVRTKLNEDGVVAPTNSLGQTPNGKIAGTSQAGDLPPVDLRTNKFKKLPGFYRDLFRRKKRV